ncbi:MAG: tyrosine recombinase [Oscillospiraceae bacterium]|nr:tyrosine recombinase [Oscillospiraceae bacterium]
MFDSSYIAVFRAYLLDVRKAPGNTVLSYIRDITKFTDFIETRGLTGYASAGEEDVRAYVKELESAGRAPATVSRCISSLKVFFARMAQDGVIAQNPAANVSGATVKKTLPDALTGDDVLRLLDQPDVKSLLGRRDKAMLETLYATGLRVSELVSLDVNDVNLDTGLINCRGSGGRSIPIYPAAAASISGYIAVSRVNLAAEGEVALFVNSGGKRMSRQGFWKLLKNYAEKAHIDSSITPQILRNSFATHMLENGADIKTLQQMLGHTDIASTQLYAQLVKKQLKDVYNKSHPRAIK